MVTEQKARPEIPNEETLPGPPGKQTFSGFAEYVELMRQCWDHVSPLSFSSISFLVLILFLHRAISQSSAQFSSIKRSYLQVFYRVQLEILKTGYTIYNLSH